MKKTTNCYALVITYNILFACISRTSFVNFGYDGYYRLETFLISLKASPSFTKVAFTFLHVNDLKFELKIQV